MRKKDSILKKYKYIHAGGHRRNRRIFLVDFSLIMAERKALQRVESLNYITFSFSFLSQLRSVCFCFDRKCFREKWLFSYFPENMFWKTVLFFVFGCDLQNEHNLFVVENVFIDVFCGVPNRGKYRKRFPESMVHQNEQRQLISLRTRYFFATVDMTCCTWCMIKMCKSTFGLYILSYFLIWSVNWFYS